jgi:hypothetical protein
MHTYGYTRRVSPLHKFLTHPSFPFHLPSSRTSTLTYSSRTFILAYPSISTLPHIPSSPRSTYLCLCFGFLLQIIYTYRPFFLRTLLHPSHSFLTELRTFMPRDCILAAPLPTLSPANRELRSWTPDCGARRRLGRRSVLQAQVGVWMCEVWMRERRVVRGAKRVRRSGRRTARGSILAIRCGCWGRCRGGESWEVG